MRKVMVVGTGGVLVEKAASQQKEVDAAKASDMLSHTFTRKGRTPVRPKTIG